MGTASLTLHTGLAPLAWIYGAVTAIRNKLFDQGILPSESFDIPIICIGNLAVGGTGKTPHTEYLIKLLQDCYQTAVLSRGYKRRTSGYLLATPQTKVEEIGDEPYQMHRKFSSVFVAVDEDRRHGIRQLLQSEHTGGIEVVLLDDAFQHRYVKVGLNILLTDYHRLFCDDKLLPEGRLRESAYGKSRAQIVIVTKCPDDIKPIDFNIIAKRLDLFPYQHLYFSAVRYGKLTPLFEKDGAPLPPLKTTEVLLVTGIASPDDLQETLEREAKRVVSLPFGDHHRFTPQDLDLIKKRFEELPEGHRLIVTTEKDATRLETHPALEEWMKAYLYVLPIEIEILQNQQTTFNKQIFDYVRENRRDSSFPEREDAHQP
ncbi:MAG: tetraacyldisaccharide 4'-kinase [Mediterranea sp.]|jgi:tetraacyldisaccharide 4'-kinase|nr:tetraacyldisaccharide 4'-kinase [Mediterranea sp.]